MHFTRLVLKSGVDLGKVKDFVSSDTIKSAWLETKTLYCEQRMLSKRSDL